MRSLNSSTRGFETTGYLTWAALGAIKTPHAGPAVFFKRASGAYLYDEDDKQYIDYVASWGPALHLATGSGPCS